MFDPSLLSGRYVHCSSGIRLAESDDLERAIGAMIGWVADRPTQHLTDESVWDREAAHTVARITDVHRHWDGDRQIIYSIDTIQRNRIVRYFPTDIQDGRMHRISWQR